jgi:hypothetical protein
MSKVVLVVVNTPSDASKLYPVPTSVILIPENVATPAVAVTGFVPLRPPGPPVVGVPEVIDRVMVPVYPVATFPNWSNAVTTIGGLMVAFWFVVVGWVVKVR